LDERARKEGVSKAALVRRALLAYGVEAESVLERTGYGVIKHLVGKSRGSPKDLSISSEASCRLRALSLRQVREGLIAAGPQERS
jgi:hypothetical protein